MELNHKYTVSEVRELFSTSVIDTFAATDDGQAHLNRIAKAITNESLDKRMATQRHTLAEGAFNKELAKVAAKSPERVSEFMANKDTWIEKHIAKKYGTDEE